MGIASSRANFYINDRSVGYYSAAGVNLAVTTPPW